MAYSGRRIVPEGRRAAVRRALSGLFPSANGRLRSIKRRDSALTSHQLPSAIRFFPTLRRLSLILVVAVLAGCATHTQSLRSLSERLPLHVELSDTPFFPQKDYQCGPAALATVLVASGVETTADALVPEVYLPGRQGSLQTELIAATRRHGRMPYVLAPEFDDLITEVAAGRPVLVLQNLQLRRWPVWHYAVVIGYDRAREQLILRSGTTQREIVSTRKFQRTWELANRWALLSIEPGDVPARPDLNRFMSAAAGLEATGKTQAAAASYSRAQALWPEAALPWLGLANLAYARGDLPAAQAAYTAAIERDPANAAARSNLAQTMAERGCVSAAQHEIERALHFARGTSLEDEVMKASRTIDGMPQREGCADPPL